MADIPQRLNSLVWGAPALVLILGMGIYLSIRTGFAQIRLLPRALGALFRRVRHRNPGEGTSSFQALCTALAATAGTGNIVGTAGALALGGPGAVFWMWVSGVLGMGIKLAEVVLAVRYRQRQSDRWVAGPMYMIRNGLGKRWHFLAWIYCLFGLLASFGVGNAVQSNAAVGALEQAARLWGRDFSPWMPGLFLAAAVGTVLLGGAKRVGQVAEVLVPVAVLGYLILCAGVLVRCRQALPGAVEAILRGAFDPGAVTGGIIGSWFTPLRTGVARGVFTNEAGMGTASMAHGTAQVRQPLEQGLMGIVEVFLDTVVMCTCTALALLCSGASIPWGEDAGAALAVDAFSLVYGDWAAVFLAGALCCFALATVLGWSVYGLCCAGYLWGGGGKHLFSLTQTAVVVLGAVARSGDIWAWSELMNGLMVIPNTVALGCLAHKLKALIPRGRSCVQSAKKQ